MLENEKEMTYEEKFDTAMHMGFPSVPQRELEEKEKKES